MGMLCGSRIQPEHGGIGAIYKSYLLLYRALPRAYTLSCTQARVIPALHSLEETLPRVVRDHDGRTIFQLPNVDTQCRSVLRRTEAHGDAEAIDRSI
jgi:hypothetical protein